jgi:hypothetical protein
MLSLSSTDTKHPWDGTSFLGCPTCILKDWAPMCARPVWVGVWAGSGQSEAPGMISPVPHILSMINTFECKRHKMWQAVVYQERVFLVSQNKKGIGGPGLSTIQNAIKDPPIFSTSLSLRCGVQPHGHKRDAPLPEIISQFQAQILCLGIWDSLFQKESCFIQAWPIISRPKLSGSPGQEVKTWVFQSLSRRGLALLFPCLLSLLSSGLQVASALPPFTLLKSHLSSSFSDHTM